MSSRPSQPRKGRPLRRTRSPARPAATGGGVFDAVADPTRRAILDGLRDAPDGRTVNQIAAAFPVSRPAISRHLRILRRAALVHERKSGRERIYTLSPKPLAQIDQWLTAYRLHWAATLLDLKHFVENQPPAD